MIADISVLHDPGHPKPWIIAMNARPGKHAVLEYGLRWGIEAMFSNFNSRGLAAHCPVAHGDNGGNSSRFCFALVFVGIFGDRLEGEPGATISQRGIEQATEAMQYTQYCVLKPLDAQVDPVSEFGVSGGATQYLPSRTIEQLFKDGYLERVTQ
ncbi:MAG: glycohydrolase toxin TNT-related protein [Alphaproteobacteria bacterium]